MSAFPTGCSSKSTLTIWKDTFMIIWWLGKQQQWSLFPFIRRQNVSDRINELSPEVVHVVKIPAETQRKFRLTHIEILLVNSPDVRQV